MNNEREAFFLNADRLGVIASGLCFVHCILTPFVLSLSAVWAHYLPTGEGTHRALAVLVAAIGCFAIVRGYRKHRRLRVLFCTTGGSSFIVSGAYFGDSLPSHSAEVAVTMIGSSLMIAAHLMNHTFCKSCRRCT